MRKKIWVWGLVVFCLASTLTFSAHAADLNSSVPQSDLQIIQDNSDANAPANPPASSPSDQNGYGETYDDQGQPAPDQDSGAGDQYQNPDANNPDQSIDNNNTNTDDE